MDGIIVTSPRFGLDAHVLLFHSDDDNEALIVSRHSRQSYRARSDEIRPLLPHSASDESVRSLIHPERFVTHSTASPRAAVAAFLHFHRDTAQAARHGTLEHLKLAEDALQENRDRPQTLTDDERAELVGSAIHLLHEPQRHSDAKLRLSTTLARHIVGAEQPSSDTEALALLMYNSRLMQTVPITDEAADVFATTFLTFAKHRTIRPNFLALVTQHNRMLGEYFTAAAVSVRAKTRLGVAVTHAVTSDSQDRLELDEQIRRLLVELRLASFPPEIEPTMVSRAETFYTIATLHGQYQQRLPCRAGDDALLMRSALSSLKHHFAGSAAENISDLVPPLFHVFARAGAASLGIEQGLHRAFFALVAEQGAALQLPAVVRQQIVDYAFTQRNLHDAGMYQAVEILSSTELNSRIYPRPVQACLADLMKLTVHSSGAPIEPALESTFALLHDPHFSQVFGRDDVVDRLTKNLGQAARALPQSVKTALAQRMLYSLTAFAAADSSRRLLILCRIHELTKLDILPIAPFQNDPRWAVNNLNLMRDERLRPADRFLTAEVIGNMLWNADGRSAPLSRRYFINNCRKLMADVKLPRSLRAQLALRLNTWLSAAGQAPDSIAQKIATTLRPGQASGKSQIN